MLAFRSEAHVDRWCESRRIPRGAVFTLEQAWGLGRVWYEDRLARDWERPTPGRAGEIFASLGLTGAFWEVG